MSALSLSFTVLSTRHYSVVVLFFLESLSLSLWLYSKYRVSNR